MTGRPEPRPEVLRAGVRYLEDAAATMAAQLALNAPAYLVRSHDPEVAAETEHFGPFPTPAEAAAYADELLAELNANLKPNETPFEVTVHALLDPTGEQEYS